MKTVPCAIFFAACLPFTALAQVTPSDQAAMVAHEIALLQFDGGGSPLSATERDQAAKIVQDGLRDNAPAWIAADQQGAKLLKTIKSNSPPANDALRARIRLAVQLQQTANSALAREQAEEAQIIEAHDPAVVWDPSHLRLITKTTVDKMLAADANAASLFSVPPPPPDTEQKFAGTLAAMYPNMDSGMQVFMANAESTLPLAVPYLNSINPQKRADFITTWRPQILAGPDPINQDIRLTQVLAGTGAKAAAQVASGQGGGSLSSQFNYLQQQNMMNNALMGASRSYSPACNVPSGANEENFSFCHP